MLQDRVIGVLSSHHLSADATLIALRASMKRANDADDPPVATISHQSLSWIKASWLDALAQN
ncbi:hypothetical protein ACVWZK_008431 [Bradyrhizobium sp. GM0.4]